MTHILQIDSSARITNSVSREIIGKVSAKLGATTTIRDLLAEPLPQVSEAWLSAN